MSLKLRIAQSVTSHSEWKKRLIKAIDSGESEFTPESVCKDDNCEFGKWLYSCSAEDKSSEHYDKVKDLHAEFHKEAAEVLSLALANNKDAARKAISTGSNYLSVSSKLTRQMMVWSREA